MESFVEDINNLLNTSEVPNLMATEDKAEIMEKIRPILKAETKGEDGSPA
jgi:dynein heavy chain